MALLNFYKGQFAGLASVTKKEGNVYVTTDERAIYVDVSDSERIRLGQIVNFKDLAEFKEYLAKTNPPYSQEAFYYIAGSNALLKWVSANNSTGVDGDSIDGEWKQINSTSDVQTSLTTLTNRVAANEAAIATINGTGSGSISKALADAKSYTDTEVNAVKTTVSGVDGRLTTAEGEIDTLQSDMTQAKAAITANTSAIGTNTTNIANNKTAIEGVANRVTTLEGTVGDNTKGLVKQVNDLDTTVNDATNGLVKKVSDLDSSVSANASAISANDTAIKKNASDISTNAAAIKANADDITALKTAVGTGADGLASKVTDLQTRMGTAEGEIDDLQETTTDHTTALATINGDATTTGSIKKALADANSYTDSKIDAVNSTVSGINGRLTTAEGEIDTLQGDMTQAKVNITTNTSAITALSSNVDTKIEAAKTELSGQIAKSINAANAMEYQANISSYDELPSSNVKIGDTYVVATKFTNNGVTYHAGDMLIANGTEDEDTGAITAASLTWDHIITGYVKEQDDKLDVKSNVLMLKNYLGDNNGQLTFRTVGANEAGVVVTMTDAVEDSDGVPKSTISFDMQWGSF